MHLIKNANLKRGRRDVRKERSYRVEWPTTVRGREANRERNSRSLPFPHQPTSAFSQPSVLDHIQLIVCH
jgi:hypothetical protein